MIGLSVLRVTGMLAAVYTAFALGANPALADPALNALRQGEMRKLVVHEAPQPVSDAAFFNAEGAPVHLADWKGRVAVVNFWATWCAPCRAEMPALNALQLSTPDEIAVVTIATGRNLMPAIERFYEDAAITDLPILLDPKSALARGMGVVGLPVTVVLNKEGLEVARMIGEAEWNSPDAKAILAELAQR